MWKAVELLEAVGFEFHLDYDGELLIEAPAGLTAFDLVAELRNVRFEQDLRNAIVRRAARNLRQCVGGPMNGQPHGGSYWEIGPTYHLARAQHAAYATARDGRAFFVGNATSKRKARALIFDSKIFRDANTIDTPKAKEGP